MISKGDFINAICESKKENNISIFVGAGLCSDAKMPDWLHLLKPCANELKMDIDERTDLFKFAQYYANKFGYNKLRKIINKSLNTYQHDSKLVSSILCVGFNSIWTTNYDRIIENSLIDMNSDSNTIFDERDLVNITWQNRINIFKLNGDINNLDNIVITQNDIDNYAKKHALFLTFLKRELVTNTFVFVGYSFNDKIILSALAEINTCLGDSANTHYAIMKNKHTSEFDMFIDDLYKRYHIQTYLVENYCEIPLLFDQIHAYVLKKNVFISGSFESLDSKENIFAYYLCKSLGENLIDADYNIVTGFGRNIGYYISGAVTQKLIKDNVKNIEQRLILRPFAHIMSNEEDTKFRKTLISNANSTIYVYGQYLNNGIAENSRGTWEEYQLSRSMNRSIIPLGVTGYTAKAIFDDIKKNLLDFPYLEKYLDILENEHDFNILSSAVISILNDIDAHEQY